MTDPQSNCSSEKNGQTPSCDANSEGRAAHNPDMPDNSNEHGKKLPLETGESAGNAEENVPETAPFFESVKQHEHSSRVEQEEPNEQEEKTALPADSTSMSLLDHLAELRRRICFALLGVLVGFLLCYGFSEYLFDWLCKPLVEAMPDTSHLIYTGLPEGFLTHVKVALVAGIFIGSPFIFYQFWAFIAPGLYAEERRYIVPIALFSALFFICGAAFGYLLVFPMAFKFFMSYNTEYVVAMPKLSEYLDFSLQLLIAFGVVFEMPLVAFFLARMGVVTVKLMRRIQRYAILGIFIVAAVLTPPDVTSQLCMAVPLLILYEFSILVVKVFGKRQKTVKTEEDKTKEAQPPLQGD